MEFVRDRIIHPEVFDTEPFVCFDRKVNLVPAAKLGFIQLRRVSGDCDPAGQPFQNRKQFDVIAFGQVVRINARSLACGRKIGRITINDLSTSKGITSKNSQRVSSDEGCEVRVLSSPPHDHFGVNVDGYRLSGWSLMS